MESTNEITQGQLSSHPLLEIVHEIAHAKLSGAVRLQRDRVKAVVYFQAGEVVFAVSNQRKHRLSECALAWQYVNAAHLAAIPQKNNDVEFGYALVESGALTAERLEDLFVRLSAEVLREVLLWIEGEWTYDARVRLARSVRAHVNIQSMLLEAVRQLPPDFAAKRLSNHNRQVVPVPAALNGLALNSMEGYVLSRVDRVMQLEMLVQLGGLPEPDLMRSVYSLVLGGFLHGSLWAAVLDDAQLSRAKALTAKSKSPAGKHQSGASRPVSPTPVSSPASSPASTGQKSAAPSTETTEAVAVADRRAADGFLTRVAEAKNFYEVLDIGRQAGDDDIKRAYYMLARQFHPDRFHQDQRTTFHEGLQSAFAKVSQAYDNLRDSKLRAAHDRKLVGSSNSTGAVDPMAADHISGTPSQQAETRFQLGLTALNKGDAPQALIYCGQAAKMMPTTARYRAAYGQALAQNPNKRHDAESELKEAIRL
ncbi:MAG: DUF4388 domain-containing protein, partial [Pyrinomonadaceae bacterium]